MSAIDVVAGIDTGTSGCKVTLLDADGRVRAATYHGYPTHYDQPGWAEQDPRDWVSAARRGLHDALRISAAEEPVRLRALAFSAPHHVAVLCDESMTPLRRAIMWTDQRSAATARRTAETHGELIWARCRNVPAATWTLPQLQWLGTHEPDVLRTTRRVLFMKDFVRHAFLPHHTTDHVDASGTLLYAPEDRTWVPELLELAGLSPAAMPEVVAPDAALGTVAPEVAAELGLDADVQVVTGSADTAVELLAAGCVEPGDHTLKLATAGNVSHVEDQPSAEAGVISYPYLIAGTYYLNSATNSAAASFAWLARTLAGGESDGSFYSRLDDDAAQVPPGSDGVTFHPYLNGERAPHWNAALRASFVGLASAHGRGHLARAVMEGVAMSMREARGTDAPPIPQASLIGGGAKSAVWAQIMADVLRTDVHVRPAADSSLGGALLAAAQLGWLPRLADAPRLVQGTVTTCRPSAADADAYDRAFARYQRIQQALQPGYELDNDS
ncbi:xylulokinase [Georgenia alba]|uniref:Xylulokinase n=1 Tax=Georgenia alba TaxID=2233858 RepID=A0ABW2QAA1_9MICO